MAALKDKLDAFDGQPEQRWNKRKSVSVGERGQVYRANFSQEYLSAVYAIDGGIIKDTNIVKCDKLVLLGLDNQTFFELFVELKGHAIEQVEATLNNPLFKDSAVKKREARIIGRKIPSNTGNSITEKAKKKFIARYKCRLEFKTGPAVENIKI